MIFFAELVIRARNSLFVVVIRCFYCCRIYLRSYLFDVFYLFVVYLVYLIYLNLFIAIVYVLFYLTSSIINMYGAPIARGLRAP